MITANTNKEERMAKILAVDDDTNLLRMVVVILEAERHEVHYATNGQKALEKLTEVGEVNMVITDVSMPVMNGIDLAKELRTRHLRIPIIALSANKLEDDLGLAAALQNGGFEEYIQKPFEPEDLIATIARLLTPSADPA